MGDHKAKEAEAEELTAPKAENLAKEIVSDDIDMDGVDLSLPETGGMTDQMAMLLYRQLTVYHQADLMARANKAAKNSAKENEARLESITAGKAAALIQREYPTARARMLKIIADEKEAAEKTKAEAEAEKTAKGKGG